MNIVSHDNLMNGTKVSQDQPSYAEMMYLPFRRRIASHASKILTCHGTCIHTFDTLEAGVKLNVIPSIKEVR